MQEGRVEPIWAEQRRVDAVEGGAEDSGHDAAYDGPQHDQRRVVMRRPGLRGESAGDDEYSRQQGHEDDRTTPDAADGQLTSQQTADDECAALVSRSVADHARGRVTASERLQRCRHTSSKSTRCHARKTDHME